MKMYVSWINCHVMEIIIYLKEEKKTKSEKEEKKIHNNKNSFLAFRTFVSFLFFFRKRKRKFTCKSSLSNLKSSLLRSVATNVLHNRTSRAALNRRLKIILLLSFFFRFFFLFLLLRQHTKGKYSN